MNLFENLQLMKESDTSIVSEFKEFLSSKNAQYIANEISETKDGMQIVIYDGDWKHEHLYMKRLLDEFFTNKGIDIRIVSEEIGESGQDTYSARYDIEFNPEPKEYMADVTPLKFTTEAKLPKPPKFWDSMFRVNAIKAYNNGELTLDNIEEWETKYNGGIKPNPSLGTKEILKYYIDNKDVLEEVVDVESNTSDWKQRFKGMDIYISDKHPNYQIKKTYTSSKQEVWQVLNFKTQREVFASGTFEGAVKWVEDKDVSKSEALDNMEEGKYYGGAYDISDIAYFTRDDLDEFSNEVIEQLSNATHGDIIANVVDCYLDEDTNELELTVSYGEYEHTHKEKIDMRKIKVPKDLIKAYSNKFVNDFLWCFTADTEHEEMIKESVNSSDNSNWEFIEETTTNDEIFGDITEGGYYVRQYDDNMTGYIYPPSESEKLYRAKLESKNHVKSLGYNVFIELDAAKEFLDKTAARLAPVTYEDIKQQLEEIDVHEYLKIYIDEPISPDDVAITATIEGTLINDEPITFYDSSYIRTQGDIDFIKEQYAKASKQIDAMRERGYLGVKDESSKIEESNHNEILDKDYATGEKLYNDLKEYLTSLDQVSMDGEDCNWEPSEFNAKNLNADGEIYLECGAYILIYPYINEWAEDYFKVFVVEASDLSLQLKNGIEDIFNKYKNDKWRLVFEG